MSYIIVGSDTIYETFTDLTKLKCQRGLKDDEKQDIHELSGSISFFGTDYDMIRVKYDAGQLFTSVDFYNDIDILQGSGVIEIQGTYNEDEKIATLNVIPSDKYDLIWKNFNTEYNILDSVYAKFNVISSVERAKLEFKLNAFTENDGLGSAVGSVLTNYYARQSYEATDLEVTILTGRDGWELKDGTTNTLIRDWVGIFNEITLDNLIFQGSGGTINEQQPDTTAYLSLYTYIEGGLCLDNNNYYGTGTITYSNFMFVKDVIKHILGKIDSSITFVNELGVTGSFGFLMSNPEFKNLGIIDIASVLTQNGTAKTYPSSIANLTFEKITKLLKEYFGADWYLDENKVFYLKQYTDFTSAVSTLKSHDLTNINGFNYSENVKQYKTDNSKRYDRISTKTTSGLLDFIGVDMVFPNISNVNNKIINVDSFFFDINDICNYPQRYDENSQNQFFIAALDTSFNENLITSIENSTDEPCDSIGGTATIGGEQYIRDGSYMELSDIGATVEGNIWTNAFSASAGDVFSIYYYLNNPPDYTVTNFLIFLVISDDLNINIGTIVTALPVTNGSNAVTVIAPITSNKYKIYFRAIINTSPNFDITTFRVWNNNYYKIRKSTGALTLKTDISNVALSTANMQDAGFYSRMSDTDVTINNVDVTISSAYLEKFKKLDAITIPCRDFYNDIDVTQYVKTDLSDTCEIETAEYDAENNTMTLNLKL